METLFLADVIDIQADDPVAFTFFTGCMPMFAASVFFFFERQQVEWFGQDGLGLLQLSSMYLIYNIGDTINKIGFSLVVYGIAMRETKKARASA